MKREPSAEEKAFLEQYRPQDYPRPAVAVDLVILTIIDAQVRVLLVKRKEHPFKGGWALPGGFVRVGSGKEQGEDLDAAARRELLEETGLDPDRVLIEQLYTFGRAGRDPRMRVISVAYVALVRPDLAPIVRAGGDVSDADWFSIESLKKQELAFDHREIVDTALSRIRGKLEYSNIAFDLVPLTFTIPELRHVYAIVLDREMDPGNFRRKFNRMLEDGVIERAPGKRITASKPATVYRFKRR
ncbi:MAG: NUDIX hydrolase [Myxococcales bacterium]|nr:NUDIX hydrolase [Myxococcales bacterium]